MRLNLEIFRNMNLRRYYYENQMDDSANCFYAHPAFGL